MRAEQSGFRENSGREHIAWRYALLGTFFTLAALAILVQLVRIQVDPRKTSFLNQGEVLGKEWKTYYPARGQIYDRAGHLLAGNTRVYEVGVELNQVENPHTIALALSVSLGLDYEKTKALASQTPSDDAVHQVLANYVTQEKIDLLEQWSKDLAGVPVKRGEAPHSLAGLTYTAHLQRIYPEKDLGSNLLGFVNREGKGYFGLEEKYNNMLAGQPVYALVSIDPNKVEEAPTVPEGTSLILTLNREVQKSMEELANSSMKANGADSATIVVVNPHTGEILALATTPRMDPNEYWRYSDVFVKSTPFNRAVSQSYEPGSVYKVLTMAAALDKGAVKADTSFVDIGVFEIGGIYIYNWNSAAWGPQTMQGCLQHSLNVCLAWVASELGAKDFYASMRQFGIGQLSGVDLAGEASGRLKLPGDADWYEADLGTNSFGQGVATTPLQMAAAISAIANDGSMMAPHVVKAVINNGRQFDTSVRVLGQPIKAETARTLTQMLTASLEEEASDALVEGYRVAGKTGTAEVPTPYGYSENLTNASFVGWGPVDQKGVCVEDCVLVYVWLEKPTSSPWGSVVAAPVFSEAMERLVVLLGIPPDAVREQFEAGYSPSSGQ